MPPAGRLPSDAAFAASEIPMKKFSKAGAPARKTAGAAGPKRSYAARGDAPKRPYSPRPARDGDAPKRPYSPRPARDGDAPRRPYTPRSDDGAPRRSYTPRNDDGAPPRRSYARPAGDAAESRSAYGDPYQRTQRPPRRTDSDDAGEGARRPAGRGFTVTLDPDVARVFRGDASVNKALRLVLQLMQVIEGPGPRSDRPAPRPRTGYQGSDEARGFSRKPRFVEDDEASEE
jgi:hypothetical protein